MKICLDSYLRNICVFTILITLSALTFSSCSDDTNNTFPHNDSTNTPPQVNAGNDVTLSLPDNQVKLNPVVSDDHLPAGSSLSYSWSKTRGDGTVTFSDTTTQRPVATFSSSGTYTLQLSVGDSELTGSDTIIITVNPEGSPVDCNSIATFENEAVFLRSVYVSPTGSDINGEGTPDLPYGTLNKALSSYQPGDHIHLAAGTYAGGLSFSDIQGTEINPVKIEGPVTGEAVFQGGSEGIKFSDPRYLILRNLVFEGASHNQISLDDGGSYATPAEHIIIDAVVSRNMTGSYTTANLLKMAGVDHFYIFDSTFENGVGSSGCAIDMVGCHDGIITGNTLNNVGHSLVQAKGGSSEITIHNNILSGAGERAIQMGGSTSASYFRPSIAAGTNYEARDIRATANTILDSTTGVSYTGCIECVVANNVIVEPSVFAIRILQETRERDGVTFLQCRNGVFSNNIVFFDNSINTLINTGSNTQVDSFTFSNNLWYCSDNSSLNYGSYKAGYINTLETAGIYQENPMFEDMNNDDFHLQGTSPAINRGVSDLVSSDTDGECNVNDIGIDEYNE